MGCHPASVTEVVAQFLLPMGVNFCKHSKSNGGTEASPEAGQPRVTSKGGSIEEQQVTALGQTASKAVCPMASQHVIHRAAAAHPHHYCINGKDVGCEQQEHGSCPYDGKLDRQASPLCAEFGNKSHGFMHFEAVREKSDGEQ